MLWGTCRLLAFPFEFALPRATSSALPKRLLLVGRARGARLLLGTLLREARVSTLPLNGRKLLRAMSGFLLPGVSLSFILVLNKSRYGTEFKIRDWQVIAHD